MTSHELTQSLPRQAAPLFHPRTVQAVRPSLPKSSILLPAADSTSYRRAGQQTQLRRKGDTETIGWLDGRKSSKKNRTKPVLHETFRRRQSTADISSRNPAHQRACLQKRLLHQPPSPHALSRLDFKTPLSDVQTACSLHAQHQVALAIVGTGHELRVAIREPRHPAAREVGDRLARSRERDLQRSGRPWAALGAWRRRSDR